MSEQNPWRRHGFFVLLVLVGAALCATSAWAGGRLLNRGVGGITIDARGVVTKATVEDAQVLRRQRLEAMDKVPADLGAAVPLRMLSLKGLEAAIADAIRDSLSVSVNDLPDEIRYMAGLQRVQYIFVYPEKNDIVLAGPGEGWKLNDEGEIVGATTGRPVLRLEDFLVALRTVETAREVGISCSIDPTPEGRVRLEKFMDEARRARRQFTPQMARQIEEILGPQDITITGVPASSRLARLMVASDYQMKRIAMALEPSPVAGLPSYLDLLQNVRGGATNLMPRWWLACNYEPLARSDDGLAWEIRGSGVKAMTEDDFIAADGTVTGTGERSPAAQRWADAMTEKYDELADRVVAFAELRNIMDLCVVAALIEKEDLLARAGASLPLLTAGDSRVVADAWDPPKTVPTQVSFLRKSGYWIITASGGVEVDGWRVVDQIETVPQVGAVRERVGLPADGKWRWN